MSSFAVLRVRKLKEASVIEKADNHNRRKCKLSHTHPQIRRHKRLIGENQELGQLIDARIQGTNAKTRKDSVLAMEIVLSASPCFFRPDNPSVSGLYSREYMKAWATKSLEFARRTWGDNLICADLHLDESTPHFHLIVTPILEKKRKKRGKEDYYLNNVLDANSMFGPEALSRLQTEYGNELKPLGIKRGIKGSLAQHQPLSDFYKLVNESVLERCVFL